jgi:hypothetical protein
MGLSTSTWIQGGWAVSMATVAPYRIQRRFLPRRPEHRNRAEVEAWSKAIAQSGRPIWLTVSWDLDEDYLSTWQQFANARRIEGDVECEGNCSTITNWSMTSQRFYDLVGWQNASGAAVGWNDLDSLEVGNGNTSGLSEVEQQPQQHCGPWPTLQCILAAT